ncbi:MAG: DNA alkylation repair protein [Planctomycetia bacterium]|nr:DNA alkylation repair protein [Planctomycetia bacterium]
MNLTAALQALEQAGSAQHREIYARHGVGEPTFGVSYAHLKTLVKKLRTDHALAEQLWATGNHDARVLATMIADPEQTTAAQLDQWAKDLANYVITDAFAGFAARTEHAVSKAKSWHSKKGEWLAAAGWTLIARLAMDSKDLPDEFFEDYLAAIEKGIHRAPNRVRHTMNGAVIAIGLRNEMLTKLALAAAQRIGKVEVDHGATSCQTPDAVEYIQRSLARRK